MSAVAARGEAALSEALGSNPGAFSPSAGPHPQVEKLAREQARDPQDVHQEIGFFLGYWLPRSVRGFLQEKESGVWQLFGSLAAHFQAEASLASSHLELLWMVIGRHWVHSLERAEGISTFLNAVREGLRAKVKGVLKRRRLVRAIRNRFRRAAWAAETWLGLPGSLGSRLTETLLIRLHRLAPERQAKMVESLAGTSGSIQKKDFDTHMEKLIARETPAAALSPDPVSPAPPASELFSSGSQVVRDSISAIVAWFLACGQRVRVRVELLDSPAETSPSVAEPVTEPGTSSPRAVTGLWERFWALFPDLLMQPPPRSALASDPSISGGVVESAFDHKEDTS